MTNEELQLLVEKISLQYFNRPFTHIAEFNPRLRTTGGRYILRTGKVEISYLHYKEFGEEEVVQIIKHELCHYHLHLQGKGYMHKDAEFKELLYKVGAPRHCKSITRQEKKRVVKIHLYKCLGCGRVYRRRRRIQVSRYRCSKCHGNLQFMESVVM